MHFNSLDIFCHVIDNFGDIGVTYRFVNEFRKVHPEIRIRVFVDDYSALISIQPCIDNQKRIQEYDGVQYIDWELIDGAFVGQFGTADVLVEAFGSAIPEIVLETASRRKTLIVNLEYLSAEKWVEGYHLKESLLGRGELKKYFFMPGFNRNTGGIIIDTLIESKKKMLSKNKLDYVSGLVAEFELNTRPGSIMSEYKDLFGLAGLLKNGDIVFKQKEDWLIGTIFTYAFNAEPLFDALTRLDKQVLLFVFDEKSKISINRTFQIKKAQNVSESIFRLKNIVIVLQPFLPQFRYDELLAVSDFNFVRGEDSLARAILSGKPFLWHAYAQENNYQQVKVLALLETLKPNFADEGAYLRICDLFMSFNDRDSRLSIPCMQERFDWFFKELNKFGHAVEKMSYFIYQNCNLVKNFTEFLFQMEM